MVQRRIQDYGTLAEASDIKSVLRGLARSSVLQGFRFSVGSVDKLRISPGSAVTNEGILILEDENAELSIPITASPREYTVMYYHVDEDISGGVPASLNLENGILDPANINGVILGYINYPGSAVPLNSGFFLQEPELVLRNFIPNRKNNSWIVPMKGNGYMITSTSGSALSITDVFDGQAYFLRLQNNISSPILANAILTLPFKVDEFPFSLLQLKMQIDLGATVEIKVLDSVGITHDVTTIPLSSSPDISLYSLNLPKEAIQNSNTLIYLQIILNISSTNQVKIQGVGLSPYNLPV